MTEVVTAVLRGDELMSFSLEHPQVESDINSLWCPKGHIMCGPENRYGVIYSTEPDPRILCLLKLSKHHSGRGERTGIISDVAIDEGYKAENTASHLVTYVIRYARSKSYQYLQSACPVEHPTHNGLFKGCGFEIISKGEAGGVNLYQYRF